MIRSEQIQEITPAMVTQLTVNSVLELSAKRPENRLRHKYNNAVYDDEKLLLILSVTPGGFMTPAELGLLVGKAFGARYLKLSKQVLVAMVRRYRGLCTFIDTDFNAGCRFAEFMGFRPKGKIINYQDHTFQLYEVYP